MRVSIRVRGNSPIPSITEGRKTNGIKEAKSIVLEKEKT
jgi:hypothetical protein